ncbi:MAG: DUF6359 domain-containing protein [Bacteroidales bacterium]|nr:DUF6359 domain-containing protein [Bacteroidales bacterium]
MRKIYSLLFALLAFAGLANAQVTFDFSTDDAYSLFGLNGFSSGSGATYVADGDITADVSTTSSDVTITVSANPSGTVNRMWTGSLRLYGGTMTVSASLKNITAIKFTLNSSKWGANNSADCGTLETGSWSGNASTVVITIAANTQIKKMEVYQEGDDAPVTIDWSSSVESPLTVAQVMEKAAGLEATETSVKEVFVKGVVTTISTDDFNTEYGNLTYTIADETGSNTTLYVYRGYGLGGAKFTSVEDLATGDQVIVGGVVKNFVTDDGSLIELTNSKLYSLNGETSGGEEGGDDPVETLEYNAEGDGAAIGTAYNADAIRSKSDDTVETGKWVKAVVLGYIKGSSLTENNVVLGSSSPDGGDVVASNIVLIDEAHNSVTAMPNVGYMLPVQLPNTDVRKALNLADNPTLVGQTIWIYGDAQKYMGVMGVKNVTKYSFDGATILPEGGGEEGGGEEGGDDPTPTEGTGDGSLTNPFNFVAAASVASALESGAVTTQDYYIKGKISEIKYSFDAQHGTATFFITDDGATADNQFQVYQTYYLNNRAWVDGDTQIAVGDEVIICGKLTNYSGTTPETAAKKNYIYSLNGVTDGGDVPEPEYLELPSIARAKAAATADKQNVNLTLNDVLVTYVNGKSVYVFDGTDAILLFGDNSGIATGDKISAAVKGQLYLYNGLTEIATTSYDNLAVNSQGNAVTPQEVTIADITNSFDDYENELVTITDLTPNAESWASRNITFVDDSDNELVVRDNWSAATTLVFDPSKAYTVTGFVAIYANATATTVQLYPRTAEDIDNGEAPVVYEPTGDGQLSNAYTIEDVRHLSSKTDAPAGWISGYVVGYVNGQSYANGCIFSNEAPAAASAPATRAEEETPQVSNTNILLADDASCTDPNMCIPVQLANKYAMREALSLRDNPDLLGTKVWIEGTLTPYFSVAGLKEVVDWSFDGENYTTRIQAVEVENTNKAIYTVAGQRVNTMAQPGLYIVGGKKVLVK